MYSKYTLPVSEYYGLLGNFYKKHREENLEP